MLGFLFAFAGSFLNEISDSIGKQKMREGAISKYTVGFLTTVFGILFYIGTAVSRHVFRFSLLSLPTFIPRVLLELSLGYITMTALRGADRSTFGFIRVLTIPLLLLSDLFMGYSISSQQMLGMAVIALSIALVSSVRGFNRKDVPLLLLGSVIAVATLTLYKYDISHFNSVEAEQLIVSLFLLLFFFFMARWQAGENPFFFLRKPLFLFQAAASGGAALLGSFAYYFASASVVTAVLRGAAVLFSTLSGGFYFKERKPIIKLVMASVVILGLILLV